jgi:hypothetical protein
LLLSQGSLSCKYFGALTITVFINTHSQNLQNLSNTQWDSIINQLIDYIHELLQLGNKAMFIIKKLLSNISLIFVNFYNRIDIDTIVSKLNNNNVENMEISINFYTILVEDLSRKEVLAELHSIIHQLFAKNFSSLYLNLNASKFTTFQLLECMNSWFIYISIAESNSQEIYPYGQIEPLIKFLLNQFQVNFDVIDRMDILNRSFQVLTEILETSPKFLNPLKSILASLMFDPNLFGVYFIDNICFNQDYSQEFSEEIECFINLLIAYLNSNINYISKNLLNHDVENILTIILNLSEFKGHPIIDEKTSEQFLIFWEEFLNFYIDDDQILKETLKENYSEFDHVRNKLLNRLSLVYWKKCQYFNGAPKQEFAHYRTQVADLFIVLYQLLNIELYSNFTQSVVLQLQNYTEQSEASIEASLYLLYKITDDLTFYDDASTDKLIPFIESMFQNNLISSFNKLATENSQVNVTLLNLLSSIHFYFSKEPGSNRLLETFNFLFSIILQSSTSLDPYQKNLSLVASKTVLKICQDSQESLILFLPNLQPILNEMINSVEVDSLIRERMTNAFVSIARSMKNPSALGNIIFELIQSIIKVSLMLIGNSPSFLTNLHYTTVQLKEKLEDYAISLLSCINEIGKATQLPEDIDDYLTGVQIQEINEYWSKDPLGIKSLILNCISQFSINFEPLIENKLVTEKCCCILKNGLCEAIDGPFKFEIKTILEYLVAKFNRSNLQSIPYIHILVETIFISNFKEITSNIMEDIIGNLFLNSKNALSGDVDVVKSSIDLFNTVLETSPGLLLLSSCFQLDILGFCLGALEHHEPFVTKSVTKFWTTLIAMRKGTFENQQFFKQLMLNNDGQFGQQLTESLTLAFATNHRSNLDLFYPIFRHLIAKFPIQFKVWLRNVVVTKCVKQGRFEENEVDGFIARLMITRGQRQANDVLKKFWLQVNGLKDYV